MEERSVPRASQKVFLSQSGVSHCLARLREMLDDELFIPTTTGMQPTARAGDGPPWSATPSKPWKLPSNCRSLNLAVRPKTSPSPPMIYDHGDRAQPARDSRRRGPLIDLAIKPVTRIDLAGQIDLGRIDVAIGTFSAVPPRFKSDFLFGYDDVLITHSGQKLGAISTETLAKLSIVGRRLAANRKVRSTASSRNAVCREDRRCPDCIRRCVLGFQPGPTRRSVVAAFSRTTRAARQFKSGGDRAAPARQCFRGNSPHSNLRAALSDRSTRGAFALARTLRWACIAELAPRRPQTSDGASSN
jgi:hypothetical protein